MKYMIRIRQMMPMVTLLLLAFFLLPAPLYSNVSSHGDKKDLPKGCASCHKGHGVYNTPMLADRKDVFCFTCHGPTAKVEKARGKGLLGKDTKNKDMQREFGKPYRHPIENTGIHRYDEVLPEMDPSMPRHSECGDCHHHHAVSSGNTAAGVTGVDRGRGKVREVGFEYEVCFKCHSNSANLPGDQRDKTAQFDISNPSFHPVVSAGRNNRMPSLISPLTPASLIKCSDCHNNDDRGGPRGTHGSTYRHILVRNYSEMDGLEGPFQYALCYGCHRRSSILGNESFPYHREHVVNAAASCKTCHNSHGSSRNTHLIDFDRISVRPGRTGRLDFIDFGQGAGQCFLNCHGKDHNPATYPSGLSAPSGKSTTKGRFK
jgi:predicted CXXCH cytochrome family protein